MIALLFRNRWFALLWGVLILGSATTIATREFGDTAPAEQAPSESAEDKFARWAQEEEKPVSAEDQESDGKKRYEVRVYDRDKDVTSTVNDLPEDDNAATGGDDAAAQQADQ
ncbi:hypothetical protein OLX02_09780 [Novosphingobium sp. KCTC 2891]|uniref:hypothetical protein n=1 Tax=Novosphingobium sp. KCTC 2891 TaxID=2989730 RepID=UPI002222C601|nr:hypothetical protein [Novosphingobium sp. KCTC 2891]MCW1383112.1 hypothetical protein [Novosphingobium sp. KCTC 2891]